MQHGERVALGRMLAHPAAEFLPAARILRLVLLTHGEVRVLRRGRCDAFVFEQTCNVFCKRDALLALGRVRAPTAAGCGERQAASGIAQPHVQGGVRAHRVADDMCALQMQVIHDRSYVVARDVLRVARAIGRDVGRRVATCAESDAAVLAAQVAHLRLPAAVVAGVLVHKHHRRANAALLVIEADAVRRDRVGHAYAGVLQTSSAVSA